MKKRISKFSFSNKRGNFALTTAIVAPVLMGVVGLAVDFSIFYSQKSQMQEAADQAALAAVREAALQGWSKVDG
ncbi:MAG: TadE/TadG family type IV pilus assembly protein [Nitratireductor sp.]